MKKSSTLKPHNPGPSGSSKSTKVVGKKNTGPRQKVLSFAPKSSVPSKPTSDGISPAIEIPPSDSLSSRKWFEENVPRVRLGIVEGDPGSVIRRSTGSLGYDEYTLPEERLLTYPPITSIVRIIESEGLVDLHRQKTFFFGVSSIFAFLNYFGKKLIKLEESFCCLDDVFELLADLHKNYQPLLQIYAGFLDLLQSEVTFTTKKRSINLVNVQKSVSSFLSNIDLEDMEDPSLENAINSFTTTDFVLVNKHDHVILLVHFTTMSMRILLLAGTHFKTDFDQYNLEKIMAATAFKKGASAKAKKTAKGKKVMDKDTHDFVRGYFIKNSTTEGVEMVGNDRWGRGYWFIRPFSTKSSNEDNQVVGILVEDGYFESNSELTADSGLSVSTNIISILDTLNRRFLHESELHTGITKKLYDLFKGRVYDPDSVTREKVIASNDCFQSWIFKVFSTSDSSQNPQASLYYEYFFNLLRPPFRNLASKHSIPESDLDFLNQTPAPNFETIKTSITSLQPRLHLLTSAQIVQLYGLFSYSGLVKWACMTDADVGRELELIEIHKTVGEKLLNTQSNSAVEIIEGKRKKNPVNYVVDLKLVEETSYGSMAEVTRKKKAKLRRNYSSDSEEASSTEDEDDQSSESHNSLGRISKKDTTRSRNGKKSISPPQKPTRSSARLSRIVQTSSEE